MLQEPKHTLFYNKMHIKNRAENILPQLQYVKKRDISANVVCCETVVIGN